jgi:hypothetical protein
VNNRHTYTQTERENVYKTRTKTKKSFIINSKCVGEGEGREWCEGGKKTNKVERAKQGRNVNKNRMRVSLEREREREKERERALTNTS